MERHPCYPLSLSFTPFCLLPLSLSLSLILSCRGKGGPEESNNCDSGAFFGIVPEAVQTHTGLSAGSNERLNE